MKLRTLAMLALALAGMVATGAALAQAKSGVDLGKREYDSNCAVCHGAAGKGDGPYVILLETRTADLTTIAKRNGGVFPFERVYQTIDGTQAIKAHGTRDMPIWGTDYRIKAGEYYVDVPYDPAAYARVRILALTDYIYRLQAK